MIDRAYLSIIQRDNEDQDQPDRKHSEKHMQRINR